MPSDGSAREERRRVIHLAPFEQYVNILVAQTARDGFEPPQQAFRRRPGRPAATSTDRGRQHLGFAQLASFTRAPARQMAQPMMRLAIRGARPPHLPANRAAVKNEGASLIFDRPDLVPERARTSAIHGRLTKPYCHYRNADISSHHPMSIWQYCKWTRSGFTTP
jgi:hypothetical protein